MIKRAGFLDQSKINRILELLKSGGGGKIKFDPQFDLPAVDKIIIENSPPSDNPNALAYVTNDPNPDKRDDIHLVLPAIEKAIQDEMRKQKIDPSELSSLDLSNLENNPKINTIIILLSSMLHIFSHEKGHKKGFKDTGKLQSEEFAEAEADRAMQSFKVNSKVDPNLELKKLASKLDDLGEVSFVKDVYRIASLLPKEEKANELPKKMASKDLDVLKGDLEKLFSK
jgi:hypothetical protein